VAAILMAMRIGRSIVEWSACRTLHESVRDVPVEIVGVCVERVCTVEGVDSLRTDSVGERAVASLRCSAPTAWSPLAHQDRVGDRGGG
jgi:hypothetical protein